MLNTTIKTITNTALFAALMMGNITTPSDQTFSPLSFSINAAFAACDDPNIECISVGGVGNDGGGFGGSGGGGIQWGGNSGGSGIGSGSNGGIGSGSGGSGQSAADKKKAEECKAQVNTDYQGYADAISDAYNVALATCALLAPKASGKAGCLTTAYATKRVASTLLSSNKTDALNACN